MTDRSMKASKKIHPLSPDKAMALALRLVQAGGALQEQSRGQIDAVVDLRGNTHLLHAAQERLRLREQALGAVSQGVMICDENHLVTYVNASFSKLTGFSENEILGRKCSILQGPDTNPEIVRSIRAALNAEEAFEGEILNYRKDGEPFWNELSITPLPGTPGQPIRFIGVLRDVTKRKRTELALTESEARYRSLFENMLEGFAYCQMVLEPGQPPDFVYLEVNAAFETLTGLKNVVGRKVSEVIPGIQTADLELFEVYARVAATGCPEKYESELKSLGFWFSLSIYCPARGYFIAVFTDITAPKRAAAALLESKHFLQSALNALTAHIAILDEHGTIIEVNAAWNRFARDNIFQGSQLGLGDNYLTVCNSAAGNFSTESADVAQGIMDVMSRQREEFYLEYPCHGPREQRWFAVRVTRFAGNAPVRIVVAHENITTRKLAEEALHRKTAFFEAKVDSSLDGILVVDSQGKKVLQNARMGQLWKIPRSVLASGDDDQQVAFVSTRTKNPRSFSEKIAHLYAHPDEVSRDEIELVDGTILDRYSAPVQDKAGKHFGRIWSFRDITTERMREKKLAEALTQEKELSEKARAGEHAKTAFLAVMSHEIRTPLNGILGFSELLAHTPDLPASCRDAVATITTSGEALLRILDDILMFSRLEAGGLKVERSLFSIRDLLDEIHSLLGHVAVEKGLEFRLALGDGVPERLWNDSGRLRQILLNLAGNALKFTARGSVTLGVRFSREALKRGEPDVEFFVQDTGAGISENDQGRIFEPFSQADSSISRRYGGTGLGLSISRNLADLMGGKLTVRSRVGIGSEFSVTLPLDVPAYAIPALAESPGGILDTSFVTSHPLNILLVEDDRVNSKLMLLMLRKLGYAPLMACDGIEAVEVYSQKHPDCILMDIQMPRMDGLHATVDIRNLENATPGGSRAFITALTANILDETRIQCRDAGMDGYLSKPIKLALLAKTLAQASDTRPLRLG